MPEVSPYQPGRIGADKRHHIGRVVTTITNNYINPLVAMNVVCDDNGDLIINGVVLTPVQMRQLRRGSKRKVGPVI